MSKLLRLVYVLVLLGIGASCSWYLVSLANSGHGPEHDDDAKVDTLFVDHIRQMETWFEDFRNREDHYHNVTDRVMLPLEEQSACLTCHELFPHKKDESRRSFNNQHSHFLTCLACHLKEDMREHAVFRWTDFDRKNAITKAGPYGISRDGEGRLTNTENFISRIAPHLYDENNKRVIFTPYADKAHAQYRDAVRAGERVDHDAFRVKAEEMVGGPALACKGCHSLETDFPWDKLGFDVSRIRELQESAAVGMVENYDGTFYFPPAE